MLSIGLWLWYINIRVTITILDIIHRPVFFLKTRRFGDWILSLSSGRIYSNGSNRKIYSLSPDRRLWFLFKLKMDLWTCNSIATASLTSRNLNLVQRTQYSGLCTGGPVRAHSCYPKGSAFCFCFFRSAFLRQGSHYFRTGSMINYDSFLMS
jgi:hypothetical protein